MTIPEDRVVMETIGGVEVPVCEWCEERLTDEEIEYPRDSIQTICDECYHEHYEFTCCWCQEYDHVDHQHVYLILTEEFDDLQSGIYKIVDFPYFVDGMITGWFIRSSLERICDLPDGIDTEPHPAGHLCRECQTKVTELIVQWIDKTWKGAIE